MARDSAPRWMSSATTITTNMTALVSAARLVEKITPSLMAPMSSPAPKAMGMLSIFAMTAMARPNSSTPSPVLPVRLMPISGPRRKMPIDESTAASAHTTVETRLTGMPSSDAALAVLGRRPHRDAHVGELEEGAQRHDRDADDDDGHEVVALERLDAPAPGEARDGRVVVERRGCR